MLGPDSNRSLKIVVQRAVVDGNHITKPQAARDLVDAIERRLIEDRVINLPLDEHKLVAIDTYQFFRSMINQAHGHCVQEFVGKMDARKRFRRVWPLNLVAKRLKVAALLLFQNWKRLEYAIMQRVEELRQAVLHEFKDVQRELPVVRPLLDNDEIIQFAEALPYFAELRG